MATKSKQKYWIGVDLGGTKMMVALYDGSFKALARMRKKTRAREGAKAVVARMGEMIQSSLEQAGVAPGMLAGIGVGCPGTLDLQSGTILKAPNLGWTSVALRKMLEQRFGCPVVLVNDVDAGIFGEYSFGAARGAHRGLGVFPGTGIGAGFVLEGRIYQGGNRSAFELGHVQVMPDGPLCGCGQRGCVEALASRLSIAGAAVQAVQRGEAPALGEEAGTDLARVRSKALAKSIASGDSAVEKIVREAAGWIGVAVAMAVNLLLPDRVVLGGGLVEAMPKLFRQEVQRVARARVMHGFQDSFEVVTAQLGDDAAVQGAAAWVRTVLEAA
jgi:glucokinase